jgi:hypothetical protein
MRFPSTSVTRPTLVRLLGSGPRMAVNDEPDTHAGDITEADVERIYHGLGGLTGAALSSQLYADKGTAMEMDRRGPNASLTSS